MRSLVVVAAACAALLASTATATAAIWTPVGSGTSETISALDHRADKTVFGTANGKIFTLAGGQRANFPGLAVIDLKLNPSGTTAVAVLTGGKVARSTDGGTTWGALVQLQTYNTAFDCSVDPPVGLSNLTQDPTAVAWASDTVAYVSTNLRGSLQKTANGGATWAEASRAANGVCKFDTGGSDPVTDIAPVVGSDSVYFISQSFGGTYFTSDALVSSPAERGNSVNCFDKKPSLAVDTANSSRLIAGDRCDGGLSLQYSEDNSSNFSRPRLAPSDSAPVNGVYDVSFAGGTALWVGNGGDIFNSTDGRTAYAQRADGVNAARDWRAVSAYSATNAAVGGTGGALVVTTAASTIPDLIPPAGTISGSVNPTAGEPTQYTANVTDNAGGSGVDPASFQWSATGIPGTTGNPASIVFPSAGFYTLKVAFKDRAGNAAEATLSISVKGPSPNAGRRTLQLPGGGSITLTGPKACVAAGGSFTATLAFKKSKKKGAKTVKVTRVDFYIDKQRVKVDKRAPFRQTLTVRNLAAGSKHTLKARATIKVRRGKPPKKSVSTSFSVCP